MKRIILTNYSKNGKYPPPLVNKHVPEWNFEDISKLFASRQKGSKKTKFDMLIILLLVKPFYQNFMTGNFAYCAEKLN